MKYANNLDLVRCKTSYFFVCSLYCNYGRKLDMEESCPQELISHPLIPLTISIFSFELNYAMCEVDVAVINHACQLYSIRAVLK